MPTGPNVDIFCVWLSNAAPFCENYAKIYFDAKHLERELNRGWWNLGDPFWPIPNAALNFLIKPWSYLKACGETILL